MFTFSSIQDSTMKLQSHLVPRYRPSLLAGSPVKSLIKSLIESLADSEVVQVLMGE